MFKLSINETTTYRWSFEEDVLAYAAAGISAIGVWRQKLSDFGPQKGAELLDEQKMEVSHLFWAGGFTGSDGRTFRESLDDATEALRTAGEIRAKSLVVYSGARAGHTANHARRLIRDALNELAPMAAELGVCLAVEAMHPGCAGPWTFLTSVDDVLALLTAVASPQVKMVFDTYHLGMQPGVLDRIPELTPHIALVQLGDLKTPPAGEQNRCRLGQGVLPLREIVTALRKAGYQGYFDVELIGEEIEASDYHALIEHTRSKYQELISG